MLELYKERDVLNLFIPNLIVIKHNTKSETTEFIKEGTINFSTVARTRESKETTSEILTESGYLQKMFRYETQSVDWSKNVAFVHCTRVYTKEIQIRKQHIFLKYKIIIHKNKSKFKKDDCLLERSSSDLSSQSVFFSDLLASAEFSSE